ncbi:hypothetical protein [Actinoplanes sp. NPDC051494]|uniref:hypothetical protein n=1 Tax=Actinoplanes sp. NPDC051494 TaxID=3363907 RepID=UPI0037B792CE
MLDETATSTTHPTTEQLRHQRVQALDTPPGGSTPRPGEVDTPVSGQSDRSTATGVDSRLLDAAGAPAPLRPEPGAGRIGEGNVPLRPDPVGTRADAPLLPAEPRAGTPTPGRQLLQTGPDGRTDLVRVSVEPRFTGEGQRLGGDPSTAAGPGRPLATPAAAERPVTGGHEPSYSYTELRADGTMGPTTLRPGENVLHSQPLSARETGGTGPRGTTTTTPNERILSYSAEGRSWEVNPVAPAHRPAEAATGAKPTQVLRQNPDGSVDLLTFQTPPAHPAGPPAKPKPGEASFHDLDGPNVGKGWQSRPIGPGDKFTAEPVSQPQSPGQRLDGKEVVFKREPTSLLMKDQTTHSWTPIGQTRGVEGPPKGWGRDPDATLVTVAKAAPDGNPVFTKNGAAPGGRPESSHYRWNQADGVVEPVKVKPTAIEVAEIGTQSRSVTISQYSATGGKGGGSEVAGLRMLPDGTLGPANSRAITPSQVRYDAESGAITMNGAESQGGRPAGGGGGSGGGGARGSGGGGMSTRDTPRGSATQTEDGAVTFVKQPPRTGESSAAATAQDARTHAGAPARDTGTPPRDAGVPGNRSDAGRTLGTGKPAKGPGAGLGGPAEAAAARTMTTRPDGTVVIGEAPRNVLRKPPPDASSTADGVTVPGTSSRSHSGLPPRETDGPKGSPEPNRRAQEVLDQRHAAQDHAAATAQAKSAEIAARVTAVQQQLAAAERMTTEAPSTSKSDGLATSDATRAVAPPVPMRAPLAHEAPYVTAMPEGLSMTVQGNVVHLHSGAAPTRLVLRPGPELTVVVDGSVTSLPAIRAALAGLHLAQPPVATVEFVGTRRPVTPERAERIATTLLTGLPGTPQISLLATALTHPPAGEAAANSFRFGPAGTGPGAVKGGDVVTPPPGDPGGDPGTPPGGDPGNPPGGGNGNAAADVPPGYDFPDAPKTDLITEKPADPLPDVPVELELTRVRQLIRLLASDAGLTARETAAVITEVERHFGGDVLGPVGEGAARRVAVLEISQRAGLDRDAALRHADALGAADVNAARVALAGFRPVISVLGADNRAISRVVDLSISRAKDDGVQYTEGMRDEMVRALRAGDAQAATKVQTELAEAQRNLARFNEARQRFQDRELAEQLLEHAALIARLQERAAARAGDITVEVPPAGRTAEVDPRSEQELADDATRTQDAFATLPEMPRVEPADPTFDQRLTSLPELTITSPMPDLENLVALMAADAGLGSAATAQVLSNLRREFADAVYMPDVVAAARQAVARDVAGQASPDTAWLEPFLARITGSDDHADAATLAEISAELRVQRADRELVERVADMRIGTAGPGDTAFAEARRERLGKALQTGDHAAYEKIVGEFDATRAGREKSEAAREATLNEAFEKRLAEIKQFADELATRVANPPAQPLVRDESSVAEPGPDPAVLRAQQEADAQHLRDLRAQLNDIPSVPSAKPETAGSHSPTEIDKLLTDLPVVVEAPLPYKLAKSLSATAGLSKDATKAVVAAIDMRSGGAVVSPELLTAETRAIMRDVAERAGVDPERTRILTRDITAADTSATALAEFRTELRSAKTDRDLRTRTADLIVGDFERTGSRYTESERAGLVDALRDGDTETLGRIRERLDTEIANQRRVQEVEARRTDETTDDRLTTLGQVKPRRDFRSVLDELRTQRPVEPDGGLMMEPLRERPQPPAVPVERLTEATTAERELHTTGLDVDSRFNAAVREWRDTHPVQADRLDPVLSAVRAEFDARTGESWRRLWENDRVSGGWAAEVDRAAADLPAMLDAAVARGAGPVVGALPAEPRTEPQVEITSDKSVTLLAEDLFRRVVGAVEYDRGLELPAGRLEMMRAEFLKSMQVTYGKLGTGEEWDAYVSRQWKQLRSDLIAADLAVTAARSAAPAFRRFLAEQGGTTGALDATMSAHTVRLLGEQFARGYLREVGALQFGMEDLQQQVFSDALHALESPAHPGAGLSDAERTQRWAAQRESLRENYAARILTTQHVEEYRPDLARDFGDAVTAAAARTERTPELRSLDALPPAVAERFRAEFIASGHSLFDQVWSPAVAEGARRYDDAFLRAEREWRFHYERLQTVVRDDAFLYLQAHRHDQDVQSAVRQARGAHFSVPQWAYEAARQAFYTDAKEKLRAALDKSVDPAWAGQWNTLAEAIRAGIPGYFTEEALRRHADATGEKTPETTPNAYDIAVRAVLAEARGDIDAALHRPGAGSATRQRIVHELEARIQEAVTAAGLRAERGGHSPTVVAAAVDGLREKLAELVLSVPALLRHHVLLGDELRAAGVAFDDLLTVELPAPAAEALGRSFAYDWVSAYDKLFRGEEASVAALNGLRALAGTVQLGGGSSLSGLGDGPGTSSDDWDDDPAPAAGPQLTDFPDAPKHDLSSTGLRDDLPDVPVDRELVRVRKLAGAVAAEAGLSEREIASVLSGLDDRFGGAVLGPVGEGAARRFAVLEISRHAGLDRDTALPHADAVASPEVRTAEAGIAAFRAMISVVGADNRAIARTVDLSIAMAESEGVRYTDNTRAEMVRALRSGDEAAFARLTSDVEQARRNLARTTGTQQANALAGLESKLREHAAEIIRRNEMRAADATAADAARERYRADVVDGLKERFGPRDVEDGVTGPGPAEALGLRHVEPPVERPPAERVTDADASDLRFRQDLADEAAATGRVEDAFAGLPEMPELNVADPTFDERLMSLPDAPVETTMPELRELAESLAADAGLGAAAVRDVLQDLDQEFGDAVFGPGIQDEATRAVVRNIARRTRLDPAVLDALVERITDPDFVTATSALTELRWELRRERADQRLLQRVAELRINDAERNNIGFTESRREQLIKALQDGDEKAYRELTSELESVVQSRQEQAAAGDEPRLRALEQRLAGLKQFADELDAREAARTAAADAARQQYRQVMRELEQRGDGGLRPVDPPVRPPVRDQLEISDADREAAEADAQQQRDLRARLDDIPAAPVTLPPPAPTSADVAELLGDLPKVVEAQLPYELARSLSADAGLSGDVAQAVRAAVDQRSGGTVVTPELLAAETRAIVLDVAGRAGVDPVVAQGFARDIASAGTSVAALADFRDELRGLKAERDLRARAADGIVAASARSGSRYTDSQRDKLVDAMHRGDAETLTTMREGLDAEAVDRRRAEELAALRADEAIDARLTEMGRDQHRQTFPAVLGELRATQPEQGGEVMMAPQTQRPATVDEEPFTQAAAAERELHAAGLDADSRFAAAVQEWRAAHPAQAGALDPLLPAVRAEFDTRTARSWRQLWENGGLGDGWTSELDSAVATLPAMLDKAVADGIRSTTPVRPLGDASTAALADDMFRGIVDAVEYDRGLDLSAAHRDVVRERFKQAMVDTYERVGAGERWDAYVSRQWKDLRADLIAADLAVTAAKEAAGAFHRFLGDRAGRPGALDATMSTHSVQLLGEQFARDYLATHGQHFVGLEALQQQAFDDALAELRDPPHEVSTLSHAVRAQQWAEQRDALRTDYAGRIGTARRAEEHRPDLVRDFGNAVTDAAARTERIPHLRSLDGLPADVADQFRADFIAAGRGLFDQVWSPVITAGARGYDTAFQAAERQWQVNYEHLLTGVRDNAFRYLQAHRHDAAVQAAVLEARDAEWEVPESAYAAAVRAFYADAQDAVRTAFDESADPAQAAQWEALARTIEARIPGYFTEEALRRHANTPVERTGTTLPLEAAPNAYQSTSQPFIDDARTDIGAALNRPGRDIADATRQRITHELDVRIQEATTAAELRAERGGHTPAVVAAAVDGLRRKLAELVRSVPVLLLHHALLGDEVRAAGLAFDDLLTVELPASVTEALGRSFTLDWLSAYDKLFRGEPASPAALAGLRDLAATVQLAAPVQHLTDGALRTALLDAAATLPGDLIEVPSGILLRQSASGPGAAELLAIASSFAPIPGRQRVFVGPGVDLTGFLAETATLLRDPAMRELIVVHAPLSPPALLRTIADRLGVTVALTERPTDPATARRATPVDANGTPTLQAWATHWHVRPPGAARPAPFGLEASGRSYRLPEGWVLEDLPWYAWARPARVSDTALANRIRNGDFAGDAHVLVGEPGVPVPTTVANAGVELLERVPWVPGEQIPVRWFSDPEATPEGTDSGLVRMPLLARGTRTALDEATSTLAATGNLEIRDAFLAETDPVRRDGLLIGLLGQGAAVLGALPSLHTGLPAAAASDAAMAQLLGYAHSALRGEPLPVKQVHDAAVKLSQAAKIPLMTSLAELASAHPAQQAVLLRLGELILDC